MQSLGIDKYSRRFPFLLAALLVGAGAAGTAGAAESTPPPGATTSPQQTRQRDDGGASSAVKIWEAPLVIPTYQIGPPDRNPMFYTRESYQGAEKRIYPYALQDDLLHVRQDKTYKALYLENEYVKLCVLPELGGRLFSAVDKTNGYDFFYHQHVIKPALIGMLGSWISGGIEWCAFHHHRNTTFMPVDYTLRENADGSKTIWVGELERRQRMKWLVGLTLYPGRSYIEATVKFFDRTPMPHSVLCWANVAVHVNDQYQVIFPPSVQVATYHSKIDFTRWPISDGRYRGYDYRGVDVSWWKNSPVSNSFFAWNLQEDFMGGYDHGRQAGVVHVGNHHVVCGAKLWEWGTGSYGRMWDKILTDEDGPYAELMVGAFSDNQPDYSWIKPHEVKIVKQYWYPVRQIGGFKNANLNGAVNLELKSDNVAALGFHTTARHSDARVTLRAGDQLVFQQTIEIGPERPFTQEVALPAGTEATDLRAWLASADGRELISFQPVEPKPAAELPKPVRAPPKPQDVNSVEELYLTGLRVQQIHNPSVDPMDYYQEALKRDPGDSRTNTIVGMNYNQRGMYQQAEGHLCRAIERISAQYTRPANTEAYYQLGLALRAQGKLGEASDNFYRATWDHAFHSAAYYQLAELACGKGDFATALEHVEHALATNARDTKALDVKAAILRRLGRADQAEAVARSALAEDPLDFFARNELYLTQSAWGAESDAQVTLAELKRMMQDEVEAYLELAVDYISCGLRDEAIEVLGRPVQANMGFAATYPLVHYYLGYLYEQQGDKDKAAACYRRASQMPTDYCFPFRLETIGVLKTAIRAAPSDARAYYYLGNLLFDLQPRNAITCWEQSRSLDDRLAILHRNLGWAYYRAENEIPKAIESYERAIACDRLDPRLFLELDALYQLANVPPERRLAALETSHDVVIQRNECFIREIAVLVLVGKYDRAINYLENNFFHVREGGGEIHDIYVDAHLLQGLRCMEAKQFAQALQHFQKASQYPENLSVGRPANDQRAPQVAYYTATALEALGKPREARQLYQTAAEQQPTRNWPETQFYQALCRRKLGQDEAAARVFDALIETGNSRLTQGSSADFFAKFGEQQTKQAREASARFILGLGLLGKGQTDEARQQFKQAVQLNRSHVWAKYQHAALR
jgi:tetratricopeptide (TPR) repeat protein